MAQVPQSKRRRVSESSSEQEEERNQRANESDEREIEEENDDHLLSDDTDAGDELSGEEEENDDDFFSHDTDAEDELSGEEDSDRTGSNDEDVMNDEESETDDEENDDDRSSGGVPEGDRENGESDNEERVGNDAIEGNEVSDEEDLATDVEAELQEEGAEAMMFQGTGDHEGMNIPLENKAEIKAIDELLIILAGAVRHNSSYVQIIDQLKWVKKRYREINIPTQKNALWRVLGRDNSNLVYRVYCSQCHVKVGHGKKPTRNCACGECGPGRKETYLAVFIMIRLRPQLRDLLKVPNMAQMLRYKFTRVKRDPDAIEDIYDGQKYRNLSEPGEFLSYPHNLSLQLWTDGVKLTKSSNATTYPVLLQVNELSPHARKRHTLLAGIWVANESPVMNNLMLPIVRQLNDLHDEGITWKPDPLREEVVTSRFLTTIFTADSVARAAVLRMKQYNGKFGCTFCQAPGRGIGRRRVYPVVNSPLRSNDSIRRDVLRAMQNRSGESNGVKGCSALAGIRRFDLADGVVYDILHGAFLGVAKQMTIKLFKDHGFPWYIGDPGSLATIDRRMEKIKPPSKISRRPRKISTYKKWKASEWRNWLLYYALPCLDGILREPYHSLLAKLSQAIFILNSSSISAPDLQHAGNLLNTFVQDFEEFFGLLCMSYNVHLLTHVCISVQNWGPLWVYSSFHFESMNKKFLNSIKSSQKKADQIVTRFFLSKFITHPPQQMERAPETEEELRRLLGKSKHDVPQGMPEGYYFVGTGKELMRQPTPEEIRLIIAAQQQLLPGTMITVYKKAVINGVEYQKVDRVRREFCNSFVYCQSGFWNVQKLISYTLGQGQNEERVCGFIGSRVRIAGNAFGTTYMKNCDIGAQNVPQSKAFILYHDVVAPAIRITREEREYAVPMCNCWESD